MFQFGSPFPSDHLYCRHFSSVKEGKLQTTLSENKVDKNQREKGKHKKICYDCLFYGVQQRCFRVMMKQCKGDEMENSSDQDGAQHTDQFTTIEDNDGFKGQQR
ncbi:CLUMA_CG004208, isoform A [Clunio marinus]|uniref:CLUMA_CG004208, isoform A n=1 Tax=Clunio marinus TaxID=568069 RepID=A0A1J1HR74_9DIPT|nr:CLUMA_CG004208, isoform A [Clunio marinus]